MLWPAERCWAPCIQFLKEFLDILFYYFASGIKPSPKCTCFRLSLIIWLLWLWIQPLLFSSILYAPEIVVMSWLTYWLYLLVGALVVINFNGSDVISWPLSPCPFDFCYPLIIPLYTCLSFNFGEPNMLASSYSHVCV